MNSQILHMVALQFFLLIHKIPRSGNHWSRFPLFFFLKQNTNGDPKVSINSHTVSCGQSLDRALQSSRFMLFTLLVNTSVTGFSILNTAIEKQNSNFKCIIRQLKEFYGEFFCKLKYLFLPICIFCQGWRGGLALGMQDLSSPPGINPRPVQWKWRVLTTRPPGKSQSAYF